MKHLLASTAIALMSAGPLVAQTDTGFLQSAVEGDIYSSNLVGMRLYMTEQDLATDETYSSEVRAEWDDVGEIGDLLLSADGEVKAVLLDIGGFLGIGERTIAIQMDQLRILRDPENPGEVFVALSGNQARLESAPEFERIEAGETVGGGAVVPPASVGADAPIVTEETAQRGLLMPPQLEREGYQPVDPTEFGTLNSEDLVGTSVYGVGDEVIGEISELIIGDDGTISQAVIDVGGFLGIGENPVAIGFEEMQILRGADDIRIYIDASAEALEQRPIYAE